MKPLCVVSCPIDTFSGYGARSRDFVKALIQLKDKEWDIKIMPQRWGDCPWNFLSQDDPLRQRFIGQLQQQPDIWMQITYNVNKKGPRSSIQFTLQGLDAYTDKQVATATGNGEPSSGSTPELMQEAVLAHLDKAKCINIEGIYKIIKVNL